MSATDKNVFSCTRVRFLKFFLAVLGAVVFLEYFSGLLMNGGRSIMFYSSNSSNHRMEQPLHWPKRTHGRHCFDDHVRLDMGPAPFIAVNNITIHPKNAENHSSVATNNSESSGVQINVHNSTQRSLAFKENDSKNKSSDPSLTEIPPAGESALNPDDIIVDSPEPSIEPNCDTPCPLIPPNLEGPISANLTEILLKDVKNSSLDVEEGGRYAPRNCKPHNRVAIIIPYRDREAHLAIFLNNIHPFLMKQQIDYQIFVVEQLGKSLFNRGTLMNVGYVEALKLRPWDCFIFHDVDLIPLDDRNLYTCPQQPRHLSAAVDTFNFKLPYKSIFGGVTALTTEQFKKINGYSNNFWGWGAEDDDMYNRVIYHDYHISRYPMSIARYTMLRHEKEKPNQERYKLLEKGKLYYDTNGLNNLEYNLNKLELHHLYTQLVVELHPPS